MRLHAALVTLLLPACLGAPGPIARGDCIVLKGGGEIRGELLSGLKPTTGEAPLALRTLSGAVVTVAHGEVESVLLRRLVVEDYETLRRALPDTVAAHWELAEWCRRKSLAKERAVHLSRIVELDPEHVPAHRGLGHVRFQGGWTTQEGVLAARGLVKHKGKRLSVQQRELSLEDERVSEAEKSWFRRVKQWQLWLVGDHPERNSSAIEALQAVHQADAVPALTRAFRNAPDEKHRLLYVQVLSEIAGDRPVAPLAVQSLLDESPLVRDAALNAVRGKDRANAIPAYLWALKHQQNAVVNRAGAALAQVADESVVPQLIEALVTRHECRELVLEKNEFTCNDQQFVRGVAVLPPSIGLMVMNGQLSAPQDSPAVSPFIAPELREVTVEKHEENPAVLEALYRLTARDFGYDRAAWRKWYHTGKRGGGKKK